MADRRRLGRVDHERRRFLRHRRGSARNGVGSDSCRRKSDRLTLKGSPFGLWIWMYKYLQNTIGWTNLEINASFLFIRGGRPHGVRREHRACVRTRASERDIVV